MARIRHGGWWPALVAVVLAGVGEAQPLVRRTVSTWPTRTYYLGFASFDGAEDGTIRITAGETYTLYLNGALVGTDTDPATVETWEVSFKNRDNTIAVVVEHGGEPTPYGLFCVLDSPQGTTVSSPLDRGTPWFWSGAALPNEAGSAWTKARLNRLDRIELDGEPVTFFPVQAGTLDPRGLAAFSDLDLTRARSIAGHGGGMDGSLGPLQLRSLDGLNTAFNSLSDDPRLVDGDAGSAVAFRRGATALLQSVQTDLGRLITVDRVRVVTRPPGGSGTYEDNSLRGYSIFVSKDGVNFIEVGARNQIEDFRETEVTFAPISARHVRLVVTEFSRRDASPQVGEIEVYGVGVDAEGTFRSQPLDLGSPEVKNFDRVRWFGSVNDDGTLELRFRSGDDRTTWSPWGSWHADSLFALQVPEPARWLQYEVRMTTRDLFVGPRLDSVVVDYTTDDLPVAAAAGSITPLQADIGVDTEFEYTLDVEIDAASAGVGRITVLTPYPARLEAASVTGLAGAVLDPAGTYSTNDSLVIALDPPLTESTQVRFAFRSRLLSGAHAFQALLTAPGASNPLRAAVRVDGGDTLSAVVQAVRLDYPVLTEVAPVPPVVTPNGDGINDETAIGFVLGLVSRAPVRVEIYDLSGRLVRQLPTRQLSAGTYLGSGAGADHPGRWDGRDAAGDRVPPGTYVYRVVVDLDPDDDTAVGLVGVAY